VFLRHGSADIVTLDEVFYRRDYQLPAIVLRMLRDLGRPPVAVDMGANIGLFGVFFLERFGDARLVAIEPDERNIEVLTLCAAANGGDAQWEIVPAAASSADGEVRFVRSDFTLSRIGDEGELTPAVDAFRYLERADVAKIDIEGGEWALLGDARFLDGRARALVLEYHPYLCPISDARAAATRALEAADFDVRPVHHFEHGHGVLWATR
jgi:FkbM family methyltransferase